MTTPDRHTDWFGLLIGDALGLTAADAELIERDATTRRAGGIDELVRFCTFDINGGNAKRAKRRLAEYEQQHQTHPTRTALRAWARRVDLQRAPGRTALPDDDDEWTVAAEAAGSSDLDLVAVIASCGPAALWSDHRHLTPDPPAQAKFVGSEGDGEMPLRDMCIHHGFDQLDRVAAIANARNDDELLRWTAIARADLVWRRYADRTRADRALSGATRRTWRMRLSGAHPSPRILALARVVQGDWLMTPHSAPELLDVVDGQLRTLHDVDGRSLATPGEHDEAGLQLACALYDDAKKAVSHLDLPRLRAALHFRSALIAGRHNDHPTQRRELQLARTAHQASGDSAGAMLTDVALLVNDLAQDRRHEHELAMRSGIDAPSSGVIARVRAWALSDGSTSWAVALGHVLRGAGEEWKNQGHRGRAFTAFRSAEWLLDLAKDQTLRYQAAESAARCDDVNSRVIDRMERLLMRIRDDGPNRSRRLHLLQQVSALQMIMNAHMSRLVPGQHPARAMRRVGRELATLLEQIEREAPETDHERLYEPLLASVPGTLATANVWMAVQLGEHAWEIGQVESAQHHFSAALALAESMVSATGAVLQPIILHRAGRTDEAKDALLRLIVAGRLESGYAAQIALKLGMFENVTPRQSAAITWSDHLFDARLHLGTGHAHQAIEASERAVEAFERAVDDLVRETDQVAMANQLPTAQLYVTATKSVLAAAAEPTVSDAERRQMFERTLRYADCARFIAQRHVPPEVGSVLWRRWREAAATATLAEDELVKATLGSDHAAIVSSFRRSDDASRRLYEAEEELDRVAPATLRHSRTIGRAERWELERLAAGVVVLAYLRSAEDLIVWALSNDGVRVEPTVVDPDELLRSIFDFRTACTQGYEDARAAQKLSDLLLGSVADVLRASERVVIVPFGPVSAVPIHALPFDGAPLGTTHVVTYCSSVATALSRHPLDHAVDPGNALVVGDPAFTPERQDLWRLPGAESEARLVSNILDCPSDAVLIGVDATEAAVRQLLPGRNVVHFATHGLLDEESPYASSLVMAGADELTVAELVGMHLDSSLVVLSACDTGRGAATLGGDVVGLARALVQAGVHDVIVSLWPVDDYVAPILMKAFYLSLVAGESPARALATATRILYGLSEHELHAECVEAVGTPGGGRLRAPRAATRSDTRDDEVPTQASGGNVARYWAPFVLYHG